MTQVYTLSFFLTEDGDLQIPDVQWSGAFGDVRAWAQRRLEYLGSGKRPSHQLRLRQCAIKNEEGHVILVIELI